jgi:formylglycine-generating enzyme required for sulfatase activity
MKTANIFWRDLLRQVRLFPLAALFTALPLCAQVPSLINYQGRLTDGSGSPVSGNRTMAVRLYDAGSGGNMTYAETIGTVSVANGTYSFQFGASGNGIVSVLSGQDYLALTVNGTEETTRTRLLAVPFALKAKESETSADAQQLRAELVAAGVLAPANMVIVAGGTLPQGSGLAGQTVATFQIGKYEVTWGEWKEVRDWAVLNGYSDLAGVGDTYPSGSADNFPVINVSWYDVVKWMNAKSQKEGLTPVYKVVGSGETYKTGQSAPTLNSRASGYRLPTEAEWEWAARGGLSGKGTIYSGSSDVNAVAWYVSTAFFVTTTSQIGSSDVNAVAWYVSNSFGGTKAVGTKAANELFIHDMSGNVWEWCEDVVLFSSLTSSRRFRGGSWGHYADYCAVASRGSSTNPVIGDYYIGFRLARSSGN